MDSTVWFENGKLLKKRSNLQATCTSQPVLKFRPFFTEQSWSTDPFVLFQNSIRHEIQDLYIMLRSAAFRIDAFKTSDAIALQQWLVEFSQMVSLYFLVQEKILYPIVLSRLEDINVSMADLRKKTQPLVNALLAIHRESLVFVSACQGRDNDRLLNFDTNTLHKTLQQLSKLVFTFVAEIEQFFTWELENVTPGILRSMNRNETRALERKAIVKMVSYDIGEHVFGGYSQWIPSVVKEQHLADIDRFKLIRLRNREKKWFKTHKALQMQFASKRS